ncbi:MAG: TrkH family potassium uptake protein [Myxococcota bacterium]
MNNFLKYLISPSARIILIIFGIFLAAALPIRIPYIVVFIINLIIILGILLELYNEYITTTFSKKFIFFRSVILLLSFIFLFEAGALLLKTILSIIEIRLASTAIRTYLTYFFLLITFISLTSGAQLIKIFNILRSSPALATISSFSAVITIGAMLLTLPISTVSIEKVSFIDSLFISASATCVTGLTTVDIGTYYTRFGQLIILILIQTGGIGIITMALSFPIIMGSQTTLNQVMTIKDILGVRTVREVLGVAKAVIFSTFIVESIGSVLLFLADDGIEDLGLRIFSAIFHSVSSFCNAGLSIYTKNLEGYSQNHIYITVIMLLILLGGIGYPVMMNIFNLIKDISLFRKRAHLSFHSKIVLSTTVGLIISGTIIVLLLEWHNVLGNLSTGSKIVNSLFMAITPRTAGFNTLPLDGIRHPTTLIIIILMFIGASPSSTGGGIKTTTFATMLFSFRALIKNREEVEAFRRTIPISSIYKALNVAFISLTIICISIFLLSITEKDKELVKIIFEVFSAFGTVGLSLGITPQLSSLGKIIIVFTMLIGRVGPLTIAIIFAQKKVSGSYRYPDDHIIIG